MLVFLIGYMYSGKTTVGRQLAEFLSAQGYTADFIDTDNAVEQRYHLTVDDCFRRYGESMFRTLETTVLHSLDDLQASNQTVTIVSTGGGTPCFDDNMCWMNAHGLTIYLKLPLSDILSRIAVSRRQRPLLASLSSEQRSSYVSQQLSHRQPFYSQAAIVIDAGNPDIPSLAQTIISHIRPV